MDFDMTQTLALASDEYSDTEFSQINVNLNIPIQGSIKEAKQFLLKEGENVIGRNNSCDVPILHYSLSRKHAVIEIDKESCLIYDAGSQNKTWKGKLLLKPNVKYNLEHNDSIKFGNVKSYVTIEQSKEENENTGSETGSESMILNNNDEVGSNVNTDKEYKITKKDGLPDAKDDTTLITSCNSITEASVFPSEKEKSKNQPEKLCKAVDSYNDSIDDERLMNLATIPYDKCDDSDSEITDEKLMDAVTQPYNAQTILIEKCNDFETTDDDRLMNAITQPYNVHILSNEKCNESDSETTDDERLMNAITQPYNTRTISNEKYSESGSENKDDERIVIQSNNTHTISNGKCNDSGSETADDDILVNAVTEPSNASTTHCEKCDDCDGEATNNKRLMIAKTNPNSKVDLNNKSDDELMAVATLPYDDLKESWDETTDKDKILETTIHDCNYDGSNKRAMHDSKPGNFLTISRSESNICNNTCKMDNLSGKPTNFCSKAITSDDETTDDESLINAPMQCCLKSVDKVQSALTDNLSSNAEIQKSTPNEVDLMAKAICFSANEEEDLLNAATQPYLAILSNSGEDKCQEKNENILPANICHDSYLNRSKTRKTVILQANDDEILLNASTQCSSKNASSSNCKVNKTSVLGIISTQDDKDEPPTEIFVTETIPYSQVGINKDGTNINFSVAETQEYDSFSTHPNIENAGNEYQSLNVQTEALKQQISGENYNEEKSAVADNLKLRTTQELSSSLYFHPIVKEQNSKAESHHSSVESDADSSLSVYRSKFILEESLADMSCNDILCASTQPQDIDKLQQTVIQNIEIDTSCDFLAETQEDVINSYDRKEIEKIAHNHHISTSPISPDCEWVAETPPDLLNPYEKNNIESPLGKFNSSLKRMEQPDDEEMQISRDIDSAILSTASPCTKNDINSRMEKNSDFDLRTMEHEKKLFISKEENEIKINRDEQSGIFKSKQMKILLRKADADEFCSACSVNDDDNNENCINLIKTNANIARLNLKKDDMQVLAHSTKEEADNDKKIEKCIRKSKRNLQNDDNSCTEKNKIVKQSLAFENNDYNFINEHKNKKSSKESTMEVVSICDEAKTKRATMNKRKTRNKADDSVSKTTGKSKSVKNSRKNVNKTESEKIIITNEVDNRIIEKPLAATETMSHNFTRSKSQQIFDKQEIAIKSPKQLKKATRNKPNNSAEEESTTVPQNDIFTSINHYNCEAEAANLKSPQTKFSKRTKEIKPTDCHENLGNTVNTLKIVKDDNEITDNKNKIDIKILSEKAININDDSNLDSSIIKSPESSTTLDDAFCNDTKQLRKSSRQQKSKNCPEFEMYPSKRSKRANSIQSVPVINSNKDADSTDVAKETNSKKNHRKEDLHTEESNGNMTRSRRNKTQENKTTGNISGELIDNIAKKLLENKDKNFTSKQLCSYKDSISLELTESAQTRTCNVKDEQLKKLSVANMTQKNKRQKTEIEDQAKFSELPVSDLEVAKQSEQKTLFEDRSELKIKLCISESIIIPKLCQTENSKPSDNIEEMAQFKRSCRSTTRLREKKLAESPKISLLDFEENQNELGKNTDVSVSKQVKMQCKTKLPNTSQNKKSRTKQKLDLEDIGASISKLLKSESESIEVKDTNKRRKSKCKNKSNIASKSKSSIKNPIKKDLVEENDINNLDDSKQLKLKIKLMKTDDDDDANICKQIKSQNSSDSSTVLEKNEISSNSTMRGNDSVLDIPKRLNSRNKRKCSITSENSISSVESSLNLTPSKTRRKTMGSQCKINQTTSPPKRNRTKLKIMFTGVADEKGQKIVTKLGGEIVDDPKVCTHLVTDKFRRTVKMLCCIAQGIPIVETKWLEDSKSEVSFVDPLKYLLKDKAAEKQYEFNLQNTLKQAVDAPLFQGWSMYATSNVKPSPDQMKDIVLSAGGKYLCRIPARFSEKTVIISCPEDLKVCKQAAKSGIAIVGAEFLLTGLLRYERDISANQLFVA